MGESKALVLSALSQDPVALEYLLTTFAAAVRSPYHATVVNPVPIRSDLVDTNGECRIERLRALWDRVPGIRKLRDLEENVLWQLLQDVLLMPHGSRKLKVRTCAPSPSWLMKLGLETKDVTVFEVGSTADEKRFQIEKQLYGSIEAYHGSDARCWFSIISNGLWLSQDEVYNRNNGRVFGNGLYFSTCLKQASCFASTGPGWDKSENAATFASVAVCEIIKHPSFVSTAGNSRTASTILVVEDAQLCKIRRILVWAHRERSKSAVASRNRVSGWGIALVGYLLALLLISDPARETLSSILVFLQNLTK